MAKKDSTTNGHTRKVATVQNYKDVFSTGPGKKVLLDLLKTHHFYSYAIDTDAIEMAQRQGERNVVARILSVMRIDINAMNQEFEQEMLEIEKDNQQGVF